MMKLISFLILSSLACKWLSGRWPWELLRNSNGNKAQAKARALLGVQARASHADIIEAHRKLISLVHPDRGGTSDQVHEANAARDLLLSELNARNVE